jgi:hypothetical protein
MSTNGARDKFTWSKSKFMVKKDLHRWSTQEQRVTMSSEKRKAHGDWIDATILDDKDTRGAYLASFSGVMPPVTTTFRAYKRKRVDAAHPVKDVILQGETERIEFEGSTTNEGDDDHCQY